MIEYSIIGIYPVSKSFVINATSGAIESEIPLNIDEVSKYLITVKAKDMGNPTLSSRVNLTVNVLDWNTHPPLLHNLPAEISLLENREPTEQLFQVNATDGDRGRNSELRFILVDGKWYGSFNVMNNAIVWTELTFHCPYSLVF